MVRSQPKRWAGAHTIWKPRQLAAGKRLHSGQLGDTTSPERAADTHPLGRDSGAKGPSQLRHTAASLAAVDGMTDGKRS